jgi:dipeptidyl aminopeptidase/acylaminoacyl peptidase
MPWDGTELWIADVTTTGTLAGARRVAGGGEEAIFQPGWSPDGVLYFVSDRTGWWNLYRQVSADREGSGPGSFESVAPINADLGRPLWQLGMSTWAFASPTQIVVSFQQFGRWRLGVIDLDARTVLPVPTELEPGENLAATATHAVFVAGWPAESESVVRLELGPNRVERLRAASSLHVGSAWFSPPEPIEFPTERGLTAHAFFYEPRNPDFTSAADERFPLIVISHGGPTASTSARLNLELQFWTSRGFAIVDVNYGGSSGYGRAYRRRLDGEWGVVDVDDCVNAAHFLASQGRIDPRRMVIRGRSAGGYTTLAALTFRPGVFAAGASYYGVGDLEAMAHETHKFESRYLDRLVGPFPEMAERYRERSPLRFVERLSCPVIFFQGLEDRVVPPAQSELMAGAIRAKGLSAPLLVFPGEQHGFRRADTIAQCLETELAFYAAALGL